MLLDLVKLQADQTTIGDLTFQLGVIYGRAKPFLPLLDEDLASFFRKEHPAGGLGEMLRLDLSLVDKTEDQPVHHYGLEYLGHVQVKGEPAEVSGMKEADSRIEMGAVYLAEGRDIHQRISEADQGVQAVLRRSACAFRERELPLFEDEVEGAVVDLPNVSLNRHEGFRRVLPIKRGACKLDGVYRIFQVHPSAQVIAEHLFHVLDGARHKPSRQIKPFYQIEIMLCLLENETTGVVVLSRVKRADVIAVVIEEMDQDFRSG